MVSVDVGNTIRVSVAFTDVTDDSACDPDSVHCSILDPSESKTDYQYGVDSEIAKTDTGSYYVDVPLTTDGYWYVRWFGLSADETPMAAEEAQVKCVPHYAD